MLDLLDYRRQMNKAYAILRQRSGDQGDHQNWQAMRAGLFGDHVRQLHLSGIVSAAVRVDQPRTSSTTPRPIAQAR